MSIFSKKDRKPRIAYKLLRDGTRLYFVEVWACYESGCMWSQSSVRTTSIKTARKLLKEISDKEITYYINNYNPYDKAGAYGIQGIGGCLISSISGSYSGIMGLPLYETSQLMHETGVQFSLKP